MDWKSLHRHGARLAPLTPLAILAAGCVVGAILLSSCRHERLTDEQLPPPGGAPEIHVCLTPAAVRSATISTTGGYHLSAGGRTVSRSSGPLRGMLIRRSGSSWQFGQIRAPGSAAELIASAGSCVRFAGTLYRGRLCLLPSGGDSFIVVNQLNLESYLAGVLPKELYPNWHGQTYRAQAIAARTYALYHIKTSGRSRPYDLGANEAWQVYGGLSAETPTATAAVRETHGQILTCGPPGAEKIFQAQYSACNGGYVNGAYVIRSAPKVAPLLGGQRDDDGRKCPRFRWPPVTVAKADIYRAVAAPYDKSQALGGLKEIRIASGTEYGRAVWLDLIGTTGRSIRIRAEDLRLTLLRAGVKNLYSMNCKLRDLGAAIEFYDGRGYGHGVGLSQWGAEDKARRGWPARRILNFYYPGATVIKAY